MTNRTQPERILQHLVDATRSAPAPGVDFERLQSSVRKTWIRNQREQPQPVIHWRWASAVAVAVSFFIGGWYGHAQHQGAKRADAEMPALLPLDGRALIQGQELEAGLEPLVVNHPGIAKWTLAPGGRARLASKGAYLTIQLDVGHLEADVIPSAQPESFAVEVGALRVAVHGTSFTVIKGNGSVEVAVTSGSVVVGSRGNPGHTQGSLLLAPNRQRYPIDLAPSEPTPVSSEPAAGSGAPPRGKLLGPASTPPASNGSMPNSPAASAEVPLPESPTRVEIETALDAVRAAAARCFAEANGGDPSHESRVMVRVDTELTVNIAPSGTISGTVFTPPIPNAIWECTRREISNFATSPSKLGAATNRQIMLTR